MAPWPIAFALLALTAACSRPGSGGAGVSKPGLFDRLLGRDWEALCLQPATLSCESFTARLSGASLAECCRVKCLAGHLGSCVVFHEHHPVRTPEFWNWPKVKSLPWEERLGIVAPPELVEYLSQEAAGGSLKPGSDVEAAGADDDLRKDLLTAWKELPAPDREDGARLLIGVAAVKGTGSQYELITIRSGRETVAGFLVLDWGTTLRPVNEWAKKPLEPSSRNHRRATLVWLLRIGIARLAGKPEPKP